MQARHLVRAAALLMLGIGFACSREVSKDINRAPVIDGASCDGLELGETRETVCEGGKVIEVCTSSGLTEAVNTCAARDCTAQDTTFAAIKPILTRSCAGCHQGYDGFEKARESASEYLRRFELPQRDAAHMPKGSSLTEEEIDSFADWIADGLCEKPATLPNTDPDQDGFISLDDAEQAMVQDLMDVGVIDAGERIDVRYLLATDLVNQGATSEEVRQYALAAAKAINSISSERKLADVVEIKPNSGIYRIKLGDFGADAADWARFENADLVNLESNTSLGKLLKELTASRLPWMHVESFADATLRNATVYYDTLGIPATFNELVALLGVDYAGDLQTRNDVLLGSFIGSPLSPHYRLISAHTNSDDGSMWVTYDTGPIDTPEKNFSRFPLLGDVGGQLNAQFVAGEVIFTLPNGLHGYALFNAVDQVVNGVFIRSDLDARQDVAPVAVVRDFLSPVSSEIAVGASCFRCHANGILPFRDQVRQNVVANGIQFGTDKDLILDIFKPQPVLDAAIRNENSVYLGALGELGIEPIGDEPISATQDAHLLPWTFEKVCATLFLERSDCRVLLNQSVTAQSEWGPLFAGGTLPFETFSQTVQAVIDELRLFEDPI